MRVGAGLSVRAKNAKEAAAMDKKKIAFIVVTVLSVVVSLVACALGLPYTPVDIDYDYVSDASLPPDGDASAVWVAGTESPGADFGLCAPYGTGTD